MKVAVVFDLKGDDPGSARAAAVARALSPEVIAVAAGGAAPADLQARVARLGLAQAAVVCDPALGGDGVRAHAWALGGLTRHVGADLVLVGVLAAEDTFGLLPAALAGERAVPGVFRVIDVVPDPADGAAVVVALRLGGLLRRLRVRLPAVLSLLADEAEAPAPPAPATIAITKVELGDLGLQQATLPPETNSAAKFTSWQRKPTAVSDVAALLGRS